MYLKDVHESSLEVKPGRNARGPIGGIAPPREQKGGVWKLLGEFVEMEMLRKKEPSVNVFHVHFGKDVGVATALQNVSFLLQVCVHAPPNALATLAGPMG